MRLSKTAWLILGIGIFVIVAATLGWLYFREKGEQQSLEEELATTEAALGPLTAEEEEWQNRVNDLQRQLSMARTLFDMARETFPNAVDTTDVDERLFSIADSLELEVINLSAQEPREELIEDVAYQVTSFTVIVEGSKVADPGFAAREAYIEYIDRTVNDLVAYVSSIAIDNYFSNATIELVTVNIPKIPTDDEQIQSQGATIARPSVSVRVDIYGYQGGGIQ